MNFSEKDLELAFINGSRSTPNGFKDWFNAFKRNKKQVFSMHGEYDVILADPPWAFSNKKTGGSMKSGSESRYKTLTIEEIKSLPVNRLAKENAILFMWWVGSMPQEALDVVNSWGFTIKTMTGFNWVKKTVSNKDEFGMGFWTRGGSECCLIAIKGKPEVKSRSVRSVVHALNQGHSIKPKEVHERIEALMGECKRVELFAREKRDGWDCIGKEIDGKDIREVLK